MEMEQKQLKIKNLIVGANSFLSRILTQKLLAKGQLVEGVINQNKDKLVPTISYHSSENLEQLADDFDCVYIISAYISQSKEKGTEQRLFATNVALTERVVRHFAEAKIIYASTVSVYGQAQEVWDEDSICSPVNTYGLSKLWGEKLVKMSPKYAIVRISSMYGEGMNLTTFLPRIISQAIAQKTITIWGDGSRRQNYIAVEEVAQYLILAAQSLDNACYLAVDKASYSNLEIAEIIQKKCKNSLVFVGDDLSDSYHYHNQKSRDKLGYQANQNLEYYLDKLIKWIKKMY